MLIVNEFNRNNINMTNHNKGKIGNKIQGKLYFMFPIYWTCKFVPIFDLLKKMPLT